MISLNETAGGVPLYQIKITLKGSKPPIWRRLLVRSDMKLPHVHKVIQIVMGWYDCHLHQFIIDPHAKFPNQPTFIGTPDPETMSGWGPETLNEKKFKISQLLPVAKKKVIYEYDFGDSWHHEILLEKILPPDRAFKHPICLAGANACPPEDCGGLWGYYGNFLKALNDPKHEEHESMKEWIGRDSWDPTHFDITCLNDRLNDLNKRF